MHQIFPSANSPYLVALILPTPRRCPLSSLIGANAKLAGNGNLGLDSNFDARTHFASHR